MDEIEYKNDLIYATNAQLEIFDLSFSNSSYYFLSFFDFINSNLTLIQINFDSSNCQHIIKASSSNVKIFDCYFSNSVFVDSDKYYDNQVIFKINGDSYNFWMKNITFLNVKISGYFMIFSGTNSQFVIDSLNFTANAQINCERIYSYISFDLIENSIIIFENFVVFLQSVSSHLILLSKIPNFLKIAGYFLILQNLINNDLQFNSIIEFNESTTCGCKSFFLIQTLDNDNGNSLMFPQSINFFNNKMDCEMGFLVGERSELFFH